MSLSTNHDSGEETTVRYLMLVLSTPEDPGDTEGQTPIEEWVKDTYGSGHGILGERLRPHEEAVGVKVRGGDVVVTDGPFIEAKEQIAGFDIIEAPDLDEAVAIAAKHPCAFDGAIQLHPFWPLNLDLD
ncbi:YCII-related protein [Xylanimonas cellulosilytica DSM 15894]|uniref:YCII-related protein n=1 Tax=Xylanimonas cellulosilytica (strain DSM 15894 / JCM 12276 / CECT 5975 / KCTC 9989 / LMG 20990 / NBRC 107835 / XIL07) TaxID=446471 RepID=D1BV15_XYLCX|nr:YciI family protein [Xylanimonas cellulosilytica]ACZ31254.1 YCII-related protein [Xylanimonas cellulosilytica DSM 15894]